MMVALLHGERIRATLRHLTRLAWFGLLALGVVACSGSEDTSDTSDGTSGPAPSADSAPDLAGDWTLTIDTPRGVQHPVLSIKRDGDGYTATYSGRQGLLTIDEVTRDGNRFAFPLAITVPIGTIEVSYEGVIDGDRMTGVVGNPRGEVPFSGERTE